MLSFGVSARPNFSFDDTFIVEDNGYTEVFTVLPHERY